MVQITYNLSGRIVAFLLAIGQHKFLRLLLQKSGRPLEKCHITSMQIQEESEKEDKNIFHLTKQDAVKLPLECRAIEVEF